MLLCSIGSASCDSIASTVNPTTFSYSDHEAAACVVEAEDFRSTLDLDLHGNF